TWRPMKPAPPVMKAVRDSVMGEDSLWVGRSRRRGHDKGRRALVWRRGCSAARCRQGDDVLHDLGDVLDVILVEVRMHRDRDVSLEEVGRDGAGLGLAVQGLDV